MRCHVEMGRPARALRWFEVCREALERELNTPPGERVMELAQQISSARTVEPRQLPLKPEDRPAGPVRGDNWTSWAAPYARVISPLPTSTRRLGVVASTA
jgi:hypothetical protein